MKIQDIKKIIVAVGMIFACGYGFAQQTNTLYFMEGVTERSDYNPAFQSPYNLYIDIPVLPNFSFGLGNNSLALHDIFFRKNGRDSLLSFLHPDAVGKERNNFFKSLRNTTRFNGDFSLSLLNIGLRKDKNYFTLGLSFKSQNSFYIPKDLFNIILEGTGSDSENFGKNINLNKLGINSTTYFETALGYSREIDEKLTLGAKLKFLTGIANISTNIKSLTLQTGIDRWTLDANGKIRASLPKIVNTANFTNPDGTIDFDRLGDSTSDDAGLSDYLSTDLLSNFGLGLDLGATYQLLDNLQLSAAVTDFGFIRWANNPSTFTFNKDWYTEGFKYAVGGDNDLDRWSDELADDFEGVLVNEGEGKSYTTWLQTRINAGAEYSVLDNKIAFGLLSSTLIANKTAFTDLTVSSNFRFSRFIQPTLSYSIINGGFRSIGAGVQAKLGYWSGFLAIDHIPVGNNAFNKQYVPQYIKGTSISAGLTLVFGDKRKKMIDTDGDGVTDKKDRCPNTPAGYLVDKYGCTVDADGDGVADNVDQCPDTPVGVQVDAAGCPVDADKDGVPDYLDKCPNTPEGVEVDGDGCPFDSDGDGVPDYLDSCPNTPEGIAVDESGCPVDADKDGVPDYLDKCPNTPAGVKVDANGCPVDTDGDGVPDYLDKCPTVAGIASNDGCPEIKEEVKQLFKKALNGIQFESGKSTIKKLSHPILDDIVQVMKENPDYLLTISGHTDNVGKPESNQTLSENRAKAVKDYLIKNGVEEKRLTSRGYGDTKPVDTNKTAAGRAKNRRVDLEAEYAK